MFARLLSGLGARETQHAPLAASSSQRPTPSAGTTPASSTKKNGSDTLTEKKALASSQDPESLAAATAAATQDAESFASAQDHPEVDVVRPSVEATAAATYPHLDRGISNRGEPRHGNLDQDSEHGSERRLAALLSLYTIEEQTQRRASVSALSQSLSDLSSASGSARHDLSRHALLNLDKGEWPHTLQNDVPQTSAQEDIQSAAIEALAKEAGLYLDLSASSRSLDPPDELQIQGQHEANKRILHACSNACAVAEVNVILSEGANINCTDAHGNTPLHCAARAGHAELVRHLLRMPNAALFVKNYDGHTAAQVASSMRVKSVFNERATTQALKCARSNEASLLEPLLRMMQDEKALTKTLLSQLLHAASGAGASAVVQHLIDAHHVDVDSTLRAGRSALHYAVANSQYEIIRILLERGASTEIVDMHGQKPTDASTDRISQRIIRRVESMRVKKRKQSAPHLLGSSSVPATVAPTGMDRNAIDGDYFGVSKVVMDSLVVFGFALDPDQLVTNQLSDNGNLIAALPATAADDETTMRLTLFCREALEAFLANANKGVFHMHNEKENDGSLAQHGSFVFLRKSTKESLASDSAKKSASANSDLFTNNLELELDPDHCMGAPQPAPLSVHALRDNSFGLSSLDAIAVEDDDDDLSTDSDTEVDSLSFAQRRRQDVADYYQINVNYFKPAFFPFVVTDDKGERSFCSIMCFAQVAHDKASLEARCVCLLSKLPLFTIHRRLLFDMFAVGMGHLELTRDTSQNLCARDVAASIVGKEIGQPGESPGLNVDVGTRIVTFTTPPSLSLPVVDDMCFDALMACLKPRNIAALFAALLTEQSVLLVSEHPHLLTVASHALLALLFPFSWVHCFIPILPRQAIDLIQAPFPFLLGIHSSHLEHVPGERLASLIVVNLDRDSVVVPIADISSSADASMPPLPWSHRQIIEHALAEARPQQRVQTATVGEMASFIGSPGRSFSQPKTPKDSSKLGSWSHTAARNSLPSSFHEAWGKPDTLAKRSMATAASAYVMSTQEMKRKKEMETKKSPAQDYHVKTENIAKVRAACLEVIISLVGDFGKVHFAEEAKPGVLRTTRDPKLRAFLEALLASQSWSVFANEMNTEVSSERREVELALFNTLMDNQLQHERMHVQAPRLLVHVHQDSASPVECTIRCGERLTIIDKRSSSSSSSLSSKQQQIWFRFREYRGWCLATPSDFRELSADQDRYKPLEATALHFGNESLYPAYHHSRVQGINYDPLFQTVHFVRFDDSFPSLQEEDE